MDFPCWMHAKVGIVPSLTLKGIIGGRTDERDRCRGSWVMGGSWVGRSVVGARSACARDDFVARSTQLWRNVWVWRALVRRSWLCCGRRVSDWQGGSRSQANGRGRRIYSNVCLWCGGAPRTAHARTPTFKRRAMKPCVSLAAALCSGMSLLFVPGCLHLLMYPPLCANVVACVCWLSTGFRL